MLVKLKMIHKLDWHLVFFSLFSVIFNFILLQSQRFFNDIVVVVMVVGVLIFL